MIHEEAICLLNDAPLLFSNIIIMNRKYIVQII